MNIGITTSFLVGGLLLLSILHMNFTVSSNSTEATLQLVAKNRMMAVTETMTADFGRMGYNVPANQDVIISSSPQDITFQADVDDDGSTETISWIFNSNDSTLVRTGPVSSGGPSEEMTYPVSDFELQIQGNSRIQVKVECMSPEPISHNPNGNDVYARSLWQKTFAPPSLQFRQN